MPATKKLKLEKLLKSIDRKDELSLICEWNGCGCISHSMDVFADHVTQHLHEETFSENQNGVFECRWTECGHDGAMTSFAELLCHVYFHAFHAKLKSVGASFCQKNSLSSCLLDVSNRNTIPDLPEQLHCRWQRCQVVFDNPELFYSHVSSHTDCYPPGNTPDGGCLCLWEGCKTVVKSKHRLKEHLRSHTQEKLMACATCGGLFTNATKLFDHIQRQADSEMHSYECSHCNKRCATERLLRDHMRQHVNYYRCPFCEKTCPNPSSLRIHINYRHTEDRSYKCQSCDYWGKSAVDLRRHQETHSRAWLTCEVESCSFRARYYWEMNLHCRNVHQGKVRAKYICHLCEKTYAKGFRLTNHLRQNHHFKWPPGHTRVRYKQHEDGHYRLLTVRYESSHMKEQLVTGQDQQQTSTSDQSSATSKTTALNAEVDRAVVEVRGNIGHTDISELVGEGAANATVLTSDIADFHGDVSQLSSGGPVVFLSNLELLGNVAVAMPRPESSEDAPDIPPSAEDCNLGISMEIHGMEAGNRQNGPSVSAVYVLDNGINVFNGATPYSSRENVGIPLKVIDGALLADGNVAAWRSAASDDTSATGATSPTYFLALSDCNENGLVTDHSKFTLHTA